MNIWTTEQQQQRQADQQLLEGKKPEVENQNTDANTTNLDQQKQQQREQEIWRQNYMSSYPPSNLYIYSAGGLPQMNPSGFPSTSTSYPQAIPPYWPTPPPPPPPLITPIPVAPPFNQSTQGISEASAAATAPPQPQYQESQDPTSSRYFEYLAPYRKVFNIKFFFFFI